MAIQFYGTPKLPDVLRVLEAFDNRLEAVENRLEAMELAGDDSSPEALQSKLSGLGAMLKGLAKTVDPSGGNGSA